LQNLDSIPNMLKFNKKKIAPTESFFIFSRQGGFIVNKKR
jgi:hypothetical protein